MNAEARIALIRARCRKALPVAFKPVGQFRATHPQLIKPKGKFVEVRASHPPVFCVGGEPIKGQTKRPHWMEESLIKDYALAPRRAKKVSPLTKIARQYPFRPVS